MQDRGHALRLAVIAATLIVLGGIAAAQGPPPPPAGVYGEPAPKVHEGFYLRVHIGPAYTRMHAIDDLANDVTISGSGGAFGVALGFSVKPNLILYGELFDDIAADPDIDVNGQRVTTEDVAAGAIGFGLGLKHYFMPSNTYIAGTLAFSRLTIQEDGEPVGESEYGPGVSLMAGKEWLVSSKWGLGVGGQVFFGSMAEKGADYRWTTVAVALIGTATYN